MCTDMPSTPNSESIRALVRPYDGLCSKDLFLVDFD